MRLQARWDRVLASPHAVQLSYADRAAPGAGCATHRQQALPLAQVGVDDMVVSEGQGRLPWRSAEQQAAGAAHARNGDQAAHLRERVGGVEMRMEGQAGQVCAACLASRFQTQRMVRAASPDCSTSTAR